MEILHDRATAHPKDELVAFYVSAAEATPELPAGAYITNDDPWTTRQMLRCLANINTAELSDYATLVEVSDLTQEFMFDAYEQDGDNGFDAVMKHAERLGVFSKEAGWVHETPKGRTVLSELFWEGLTIERS